MKTITLALLLGLAISPAFSQGVVSLDNYRDVYSAPNKPDPAPTRAWYGESNWYERYNHFDYTHGAPDVPFRYSIRDPYMSHYIYDDPDWDREPRGTFGGVFD